MRLMLIQGANMEWLGRREPHLYGTTTLDELHAMLAAEATARGIALDIRTTNVEGEAITWIYGAARDGIDGILINPAGFLYAGYALRDCLRGVDLPVIEIHMTNIERRGMHSVTAEAVSGMVMGLGVHSYFAALDAIARLHAARTA